MTVVRFDVRQIIGEEPLVGPVDDASFDITPGRVLETGGYLLSREVLTVRITDADDGVKTVDLPPTEAGEWAQVRGRGFEGARDWYVLVPDSASTVNFVDLTEIDPATADPVAEPEAAWYAELNNRIPPAGTTGHFLAKGAGASNTWTEAGSGDVTGPGSAVDNRVVRMDGVTGKVVQQSPVSIDDDGAITGMTTVDGRDVSVDGTKLDGIASGATANATDAQLRDRSTHTGAQAIDTVTGLQATLDGKQPSDSDLSAIAALTTTAYGRAFLELANQAALMALVPAASETVSGKIELATTAEALAGLDVERAITAAGLQAKIDALVDAAPGTLDTLAEIADALGDDPNFAATMTAALAGKQPIDSDLTAISGLTTTAYGRALLELANQAALKTYIGMTKADVGLGNVDDVQQQPLDSDLTAIAGLTPSNDDIVQRKAGAWTNRTPAQFKTDLALTKSDVGLDQATNTSDANKPVSTAQQDALNLKRNRNLPSHVPITVTNLYDHDVNAYNFKPSNTRKLRAGLGRAAVGELCEIVAIGDSSMTGAISTVGPVWDRLRAWPLRMADVLGVPLAGTGIVRCWDVIAFDSRWIAAGTWAGATSHVSSVVNGSTLTFTTAKAGDRVTVYYYDGASGETFTVHVNGALAGTVTGSGPAGWKKVTYSVPIGVGQTVVITKTGGAAIFIMGAAVWSNANGGLLLNNLAQGGSRAFGTGVDRWADDTTVQRLGQVFSKAQSVVSLTDPDCVMIALGANDKNNSVADADVVTAITAIRNRYPNSDCVLVATWPPSAVADGTWQTYLGQLYALADTLDVPLIDQYARLGPWATILANGQNGDTVAHLKASAYVNLGDNAGDLLGGSFDTSDAVRAATVQTLTNKRVTKRVFSVADAATLTIASDDYDGAKVTALAQAMTIAAPTGTPTGMQGLLIRIKDNGTARALTWNAAFRAIGVTLPTTTVISKTVYVGCIWNAEDAKWDVLAVGQQA